MEVDVYEFLGKWGDTVRAMQATVPDDEEESLRCFAHVRPPPAPNPPSGNRR